MLRDTVVQKVPLRYDNGIIYGYDIIRNKWLSIDRIYLKYGINRKNTSVDQWLYAIDGIPTNTSGYKLSRNGTIVSTTIQTQNIVDSTFHIRKNDDPSNIESIILNGVPSIIDNNLNVDVSEEDWIQTFVEITSGNIDYPIMTIEIAWRYN